MRLKSLPAKLRALVPKQGRVTVPKPPSVNALWFNVPKRGRVKTKEYRAWLAATEGAFASLESPASYPCEAYFVLEGNWNERGDGDNCNKALLDACVSAGVIVDDSLKYVRGGHWAYEPGEGEPTVTLWFEALTEIER